MSNNRLISNLTDRQKALLFNIAVEKRVILQSHVSEFLDILQGRRADLLQRLRDLGEEMGDEEVAAPAAPAGATPRRGPGRPRTSASPMSAPAGGRSAAAKSPKGPAGKAGSRKSKSGGSSAITPEQLASRQLQGRYLGLLRQIPKSQRKPYAAVAKAEGREAAIGRMSVALGR